MLYRPEAFEPLTESPWDEQRARRDSRDRRGRRPRVRSHALWPADEWDGWQSAVPMKNLYVGAAGVVWALDALRRRGHAETRIDLAAGAKRTLTFFREAPDLMAGIELPARPRSALLTGETGILLVAWRLDPSSELERNCWRTYRRTSTTTPTNSCGHARHLARGPRMQEGRWRQWRRLRRVAEALGVNATRTGRTQQLYGETSAASGRSTA